MMKNVFLGSLSLCLLFSLLSLTLLGCSPQTPAKDELKTAAKDLQQQVQSSSSAAPSATPTPPQSDKPSTAQTTAQTNAQAISQPATQPLPSGTQPQLEAPSRIEALPAIYYHAVQTLPNNELGMPPEKFEQQMAFLAKEGFHSISTSQLYDYYYNKGTLPPHPILISFDDGYMDNYKAALPIMKKYGFTGTLFLIVKKVGDPNCLTWKEVKELEQSGWDIQSHTLTHLDLTTLSSQTLQKELADSKAILEKELGKPVQFFAYPSGKFNDTVVKAVKASGYRMAFSTQKGWANETMNPLLVHRVYCYASMGLEEFKRRVTQPNY